MKSSLVQIIKNDNQVKDDINSRLHSLDQTVRSVKDCVLGNTDSLWTYSLKTTYRSTRLI